MSEQHPNPYANDGRPEGGSPHYGYPGPYPEYPAQPPTIGAGHPLVPAQTSPYGAPTPPPPPSYPAGGGGASFAIGDISVVGDQIITPSGTMPLRGATWNAVDFSRTETRMPTHAVVLAVVFFVFCLLGLLFLLMKEKTTTGYIQVTVAGGGRHHQTMIPAVDERSFPWVMAQLNHARALSL
ncbi:hypothetical protein ACN20G_32830 (plasmid) [Streptomyces sp. BI20]|uniref:hypothetical protein n=1 Tax=Streptomyces sp. BI20 TaxID=3403460 RepID=UPI003C70768B